MKYKIFFLLLHLHSAKSARHIGKTKRYARLANGNVRNFYSTQGKCDGSRVERGLVTISRTKVISRPPFEEVAYQHHASHVYIAIFGAEGLYML